MSMEAPYITLANQNDFQLMVVDMLNRSGIMADKVRNVTYLPNSDTKRMDVFREFAKCFVPKVVDSRNNYELYEFMGDSSVNKATISYLFRVLNPLLTAKGSDGAVGYMDKIKSVYVSTPFLKKMCEHLGFDEYLYRVIRDPRFRSEVAVLNDSKIKEDVVEAFFGCMEVHIDQYVSMYSGYGFISNLVIDILENINIDYNPRALWSSTILLKETNDQINSYNRRRNPNEQELPTFKIIIQDHSNGQSFYVVEKQYEPPAPAGGYNKPGQRRGKSPKDTVWADNRLKLAKQGEKKDMEEELASRVLVLLRTDDAFRGLLQEAPTPESLGIQSLMK